MGSKLVGAWIVLCLAGCAGSGGGAQGSGGTTGTGPADGGALQVRPRPSVTTTTSRGTLTGPEAFDIMSAQTQVQMSDGGFATYLGVSLTDTGQCGPSNVTIDGGGYIQPGEVTHLGRGFVRTLDGSPLAAGTYTIGMTNGDKVQTYFELVEYQRDGGGTTTYLATDGTLTIGDLDGGHLEGSIDVNLGDPATQEELPFSGQYHADSCGP